MSTSSLATPIRQRIAMTKETRLTRMRASFARVRERFGFPGNSAWAFTLQPEHLLAYATWSETRFDSEDDSFRPDERALRPPRAAGRDDAALFNGTNR